MAVASLLPIFVYFLLGVVLRTAGRASRDHAAFLFRVIFYVTLPALAFQSVATTTLTRDSLFLPVASVIINLVCMIGAILYARTTRTVRRKAGSLVLGAGTTNMVFIFPFVMAVLGPGALADAILFDMGNAIFVATAAYSAALYFGGRGGASVLSSFLKMLRSPLFIALAAAIVVSMAGLPIPDAVRQMLMPLGATTMPLSIVALGIAFSHAHLRDSQAISAVFLRVLPGLATGLLLIGAFGFRDTTAAVVVVAAAAPIGFSSVTLASVADLDTEQAAAALSISVTAGMVTTTLLLWAATKWFGAGP